MRKFKKGFTIVELVIVIAVIAVLTAVLVPTFIHLTNKANKASDESLVTNLNKALAMREAEQGEAGKNNTMYDAVLDLKEEGYLVPQLISKSGEDLIWSKKANKFFLSGSYTEKADEYGPEYNCFRIEKAIIAPESQRWGIYAGPEWTGDATGLKVSFDAGEASVSNVSYVRTEGTPSDAQEVVIRTNGAGTTLTVNAPADTVHHYDYLDDLTISAIASDSYHEHGSVRGKAIISQGHFEVAQGAQVAQVSVENVPEGKSAKITANERTIVSVDDASKTQTSVVANVTNVFVSGLTSDKISGTKASEVELPTAVSSSSELATAIATQKGFIQFSGDVTINENLTISKTVVLDLNGHTFVVNGLILNNGDLTIDDSKDNGQKKVSNVVNDAVSAKTSTNVSTESSLSYTKTLQGTLKVESIVTSANNSLTILNGSFISELDYHKYYNTSYETDGLIYVAENANAVIYNGAFFSENLEDATEEYAAAAVAVVSNRGNTAIYKGEFVTKYCRESYDKFFDGKAHSVNESSGLYNKDRMQYSYYSMCSYGGSIEISPKTNDGLTVYSARGALSFNSGKAEINGGKFYAYHYYAAYIAGSSGNVKGTISGGEFNLVNGGHLSAQYALTIGNDTAGDGGKRLPANVIILDCVVNSDKNAIKVANSTGTIVVYGGKYNKTISEDYIDTSNYRIVLEDGYYVVKSK